MKLKKSEVCKDCGKVTNERYRQMKMLNHRRWEQIQALETTIAEFQDETCEMCGKAGETYEGTCSIKCRETKARIPCAQLSCKGIKEENERLKADLNVLRYAIMGTKNGTESTEQVLVKLAKVYANQKGKR